MKKEYLYKMLLLLSSLFLLNDIYAQSIEENTTIRTDINYMFDDLDKTKITTGYLLDYAIDLVELPAYNGRVLSDTNYVDVAAFEDILRSLKSAAVRPMNHIPDITEFIDGFGTPLISRQLNVAIALFKYNYIKENALIDNLLIYENGKVTDVFHNEQWVNPYELENLLAFTPSSNICPIGNVRYNTSSAYIVKNNQIVNIQYDFGDGLGYRTVNGPYANVTYLEPGEKELKVKVKTFDGEFLEAHSIMQVVETFQFETYSDENADVIEIISEGDVKAQMSIYYAPGRSSLKRPFIIVEGFDPWYLGELFDQNVDYDAEVMLGNTRYSNFKNNYWDSSPFASDYDYVYIDWSNSLADLNDNATLLVKIIENNINPKRAADCERSIIMGQSMGGLIARIALCSMEKDGVPHGVGTFITHDTPHLGANVPVGLLYFIHHFNSFLHGYNAPADLTSEIDFDTTTMLGKLYSILYSTSVKQMLANNVDMAGNLDNTAFESMQSYLQQIGFPEGDEGYQIENLSIVNGRSYNYNQNLINDKYLYLNGFIRSRFLGQLLLSFISEEKMALVLGEGNLQYLSTIFKGLGRSRINVEAVVMPMLYHGSVVSDINFNYTKKRLWHTPINYEIFSARAIGQGLPYDIFPGSKYAISQEPYYYENYSLNLGFEYSIELGLANMITFIPTASALAININETLSSSVFQRDYYLYPPTPIIETPFNAYYLYEYSDRHIAIDYDVLQWIYDQLNMKIVGADWAQDGDYFAIEGYSGAVNWHSSDEEIASVDATGRLTVHKGGVVTITAESYYQGTKLNKTKKIVVGIPECVLSYKYETGAGYVVTASSGDESNDAIVDQLVQNGELIYEWGILEGNDDGSEIVWRDSKERTFSFLPKERSCVTVFMRLKTKDGDVGRDCNYTFNTFLMFDYNYKYVIVNDNNDVFFISEDGYESGIPSEDFKIHFLNWAFAPTDSALMNLESKYIKGNNCYLKYSLTGEDISGIRGILSTWSFGFFDSSPFLNSLSNMMLFKGNPVLDLNMVILNSLKEPLQLIPFAIMYKPDFPDVVGSE